MVDIIGRAKVIVEGDVDSPSIDRAGGKIGSALKTGALAGVAALGTLAVAGVKAVDAFAQAEAQSRKLNQVLDNMGQSDAAPAVEKLADALSRKVGIDDEVIKQGQTILATFSEVAESAGTVGGTFERATKAAVDLSATGFGTVESASVMLGKALQDPEKGITALSRAGVTFTEDQKKLIEGFVATNDVASAQAIILAEVERQVGGTAEASVTEGQKIKVAMGEIQEAIGHALSEATGGKIDGVSDALFKLSDKINEMAESKDWQEFGKNLRDIASDARAVADVIEDVYKIGNKVNDAMPDWADGWRLIPGPIGQVIDKLDDLYRLYKKVKDLLSSDTVVFKDNPYATGDLSDLLKRASGGPASGLTLVGERGPELVNLPAGSNVYNNNDTKDMLSGSTTNVFNISTIGPVGPSLLQELNWWGKYAQPEAVSV